jgi:hypothetical protein
MIVVMVYDERIARESGVLRCVECGRQPNEGENAEDEWRCYSDGLGELPAFCPGCAEREFGATARGRNERAWKVSRSARGQMG